MCPSKLFGTPKQLPPPEEKVKTEVAKTQAPPDFGSKTKSDARTALANRSGTSRFRIDLKTGDDSGSGLGIPA